MNKRSINLPEGVLAVIGILNRSGYEAYAVGGCVRDSILGRTPTDWDITTNAGPHEIKKLFAKTVDTGIKHGTVTVLLENESYEVTTYRVDGEYADNRRPVTVEFTASLERDLGRRDFTMNAIGCHPCEGFVDPFDGLADIENSTIRTVGNADERFGEDALRMLRAVRFSAQLNFSVSGDVLKSIKDNSALIKHISSERIREELTKILVSEHSLKFVLLRDTGLLQFIMPEFEACFRTQQNNPHHIYNVAEHTLYSVSYIENSKHLRWAMLLHDIGKAVTRTTDAEGIDHFYHHSEKSMQLAGVILKRLRFDNKIIERITRLIEFHDMEIKPEPKSVRKALAVVGEDIFDDLIRIKKSDRKAQSPHFMEEEIRKIIRIESIYHSIRERKECFNLKSLAVNGDDLIRMGFGQGRQIKVVLDKLLDMVIENPALNDRAKLIEIVKNLYK